MIINLFDPILKRSLQKHFCDKCGDIIYQEYEGNHFPDDKKEAEKEHKKKCCGFWRIDKRGRFNEHIKNKNVLVWDEANDLIVRKGVSE
jgi:hypothetical protein